MKNTTIQIKIPVADRQPPAMNAKQCNYICKALFKDLVKREAVRRVVIDGISANAAELEAYGKETKTVSRDVRKVRGVYLWAMGLEPTAIDNV